MKRITLKFEDPVLENLYFQRHKNDLYHSLIFQVTLMDVMSVLYIYFATQRGDYFGITLRILLLIFSPFVYIFSKRSIACYKFFSLSTHFLYSAVIVETSSFLYRRNIEEMFWLGHVYSLIITVSMGVFCWYYQAINLIISFFHSVIRVPNGGPLLGAGGALLILTIHNLYVREKFIRNSFLQAKEIENQRQLWEFVVKEIFKGSIIMIKPQDPRSSRLNTYIRRMTLVPGIKDLARPNAAEKKKVKEGNENLLEKLSFEIADISPEIQENFSLNCQDDIYKFLAGFEIEKIDEQEYENLNLQNHLNDLMKELSKGKTQFAKVVNHKIKGKTGKKKIELHSVSFVWKNEPHMILKFNSEEYLKEKINSMRKLDKFKDQFLASITHDLRTPLFGVEVMIDSANAEKDQESRSRLLNLAKMNTKLLLNLVNDILDYSQLKENKFHLNLNTFSLVHLLSEVVSLMRIQADMKGLRLECQNLCDETFMMYSDSRRLKQVLINLLSNSMKFTEKGQIIIRVSPLGPLFLKIEVVDSGNGIKKEIIPHLSKPYTTFDSGTGSNREGIGLGLFNCKNIISRLGPTENIYISSKYGSGSKFGFIVHKIVPSLHEERSALASGQSKDISNHLCRNSITEQKSELAIAKHEDSHFNDFESAFSSFASMDIEEGTVSDCKLEFIERNVAHDSKKMDIGERPKNMKFSVMIVDDSPFNLLVIEKFIEKARLEFEITTWTAPHGKKAVELFNKFNKKNADNPIRIIFMDCRMPIMNGFEASREIKALSSKGTHVDAFIIGLTSFIGDEERDSAFYSQMCDIHIKPISEHEFLDLIKKIAEKMKQS